MAGARVVDVDSTMISVTLTETTDETFLLRLDPIAPDASRSTEFRIVGVEPRIWWVNGIDGVTTDVRAHFVLVRVPLVAGVLEFTPSSY